MTKNTHTERVVLKQSQATETKKKHFCNYFLKRNGRKTREINIKKEQRNEWEPNPTENHKKKKIKEETINDEPHHDSIRSRHSQQTKKKPKRQR